MSVRLSWDDLPGSTRDAVQGRTGPVLAAANASAGRNSAFSATLRTTDGQVFCKGVEVDGPQVFMQRNEATVNLFLPEHLAPRLLWRVEQDGWLLLGFDHVPGHHADLSPASPDLPLVSNAVRRLAAVATPPPSAGRRAVAEHWATVLGGSRHPLVGVAARAPRHMHGDTLIHSDLNPWNILVGDTARVVDWAWWRTGAAWIDPAFLVVRLIAAGHEPARAEAWAAQFDGYRTAEPEAITAYAASLVCLWEERFPDTDPTNAARDWVRFRLG